MERKEIKERVNKVLTKWSDDIGYEESEITDKAKITEDLGFDSLDQVDLVMDLEKEFNTTITDELVEDIKTVGDIYEIIEKVLK